MRDRVIQEHYHSGSSGVTKENDVSRLSDLTDRKQEIVARPAADQNDNEIADQLSVSDETMKTHPHHTYQKLSVEGCIETIIT